MITASLSQPDQDQLVLLIEKCKFLNEMHHRSTLMKRLPESLRPHIPAASCLRTFLTGVVGTCARHPGGIHALRQAIGWLEGHTYALQAIEDFLTARGIIDATATATAQDDSVTTSGFDTSEIDRQIEEALQRKANLAACGLPTIDADQDILVLKRQRRQGGQLRSGDRLGDRYVLHKQCGVGGFGRVWDAVDTESQTRVAIKVLHGHLAGSVLQRDRFFRGARIASEIAHNAVIHIRERKAEDDGFHFFVMDFIAGGDLRQAVLDQRVPKENIIPVLLTVADAVAEVHRRGYAHRDIKPTNILLTESGAPKLTDFDLVAAPDTTGGTQTGLGMGTLYFAPPELLHNAADTDARVDVFGLGMTAVFMLYGRDLPLDVWSDRKRFMDALPCSQHLRHVLRRAVALDRSERYPDAATLCEALRTVGPNIAVCDRQREVLWVDDRPENNVYERYILKHAGVHVRIARTTQEAIDLLDSREFVAIISDMGRTEGPREGYKLLHWLRIAGRSTPFFVYTSGNMEKHRSEIIEHGGQGATELPGELCDMVLRAIGER